MRNQSQNMWEECSGRKNGCIMLSVGVSHMLWCFTMWVCPGSRYASDCARPSSWRTTDLSFIRLAPSTLSVCYCRYSRFNVFLFMFEYFLDFSHISIELVHTRDIVKKIFFVFPCCCTTHWFFFNSNNPRWHNTSLPPLLAARPLASDTKS